MNLFRLKTGLLKFGKKFLKEIIIAFVLAIVAAIIIEVYLDHSRNKMLENNTKAVATLMVYNAKAELIASASGIFISSDGNLVTNYHVIKNAYNIDAKLSSGAYYKVKECIGISKIHDLAILKFDAKDVPFIKIRKVDKINIGEAVFTIGSPIGLEKSVSEGIISNPQRQEGGIDLIQFTAPISSGNSGGGLFTKHGIIIGITTNTIIPSQPNENVQNLNFAVPVKYVEKAITGQDIEFTENNPDFYYSQGVIYSNKKEYEKAEACLKKAISKDVNYVDAYIKLGEIYYYLEKYDDEVKVLEVAKTIMPNDTDVYFSLANAYEDISKYDLAISAYEKNLELKPNDKDALYDICVLYIMTGLKNKAVKFIPTLSKMNPGLGKEIEMLISQTK
jgi:tetratricopeptide (TPR) repeat protein